MREEGGVMALCPSNMMVDGNPLPNLGDPPFRAERAEVAKAELMKVLPEVEFVISIEDRRLYKPGTRAHELAMMGIHGFREVAPDDIETIAVYHIDGKAYGWTFSRRWYYWACWADDRYNPSPSRAIPEDVAREFNTRWGSQVRVDGYSGGNDVTGLVANYHVDTMDGLAALVDMIRRVCGEESR